MHRLSILSRVVIALLLPFLLAGVFLQVSESRALPESIGFALFVGVIASVAIGYRLVATQFRRFAVLIAVIYFPVILGFLAYFVLWLSASLTVGPWP